MIYGHWLIYGDSGAGKTTSAATFPTPMLVFMFDPKGKDTPYLRRGHPTTLITDEEGVDHREVLDPKTGDTLVYLEYYLDRDITNPRSYSAFTRRLVYLEKDIDDRKLKTVVVDSVTFMELMARKLAQYKLNPTSKEPRQWFASSTDSLEEILMIRLGCLDLNVVVLAHIDEDKDEVHGMYVRNPSAPGRLRKRSPAGYSELYRAFVKRNDRGEREYLWQTRSDMLYNASSQLSVPDPCPQTWTALTAPS